MDILNGNMGQTKEVPVLLMICTTILATVCGFLVYFYSPYWSVRKVPGPPALPLIGHLHMLAKHGPDLFTLLAKTYGPIYRFHMGRQPLVIIADAELCREVGIKKFKDFPNRSIPSPIAATPLHQKALLFSKEPRWSTTRNKILSLYQPSYLANLVPTMQSYIESATQNLESLGDFNILELSHKLGTDIVGQSAFGVDFGLSKPRLAATCSKENDQEGQEFIKQHIYATTTLKMDLSGSLSMILGLLFPLIQEPVRQILIRIPGTMDRKIDKTNKNLSRQIDEIVLKRKKETVRGTKDFLSLILSASESETAAKKVFTQDYISALTYEQLLAGSTTLSFQLSTVIYLVAEHPQVEKKLLQEIDDFGPLDQLPTALDLHQQFPYLDQVIKEAMRIFTASPLNAREALTDVEIGGYFLPKGTWVWIAPGALAKDPKHFNEPDKFKPERFDPNCEEEKTRHPYAFIPFGLGPRACLGQKFAIQEMKLTLIHLYRKYIFRHSDTMEKPLALEYGMILNFKHGVKVRAIKRTT